MERRKEEGVRHEGKRWNEERVKSKKAKEGWFEGRRKEETRKEEKEVE